jgi:hypothetical protein
MGAATDALIANLQQTRTSQFNEPAIVTIALFIACLQELEGSSGTSALLVESGASSKISALPAAGALAGGELAVVVQAGADVQTTAQAIANLAPSGGVSLLLESGGVSKKISALPAAAALTGAELAVLVQGGADVQSTSAAIAALAAGGTPANPTATAGPAAINGVATTYMRSDAAPAIQKCSSSVFGLCEVDGTTITASGGVISGVAGGTVPVTTVAASGASQALTFATSGSKCYDITLTANCAITLTGGTAGQLQTITLILRQSGGGGFTPTLPAGVEWPGGQAPSPNTVSGKIDVFYLSTPDASTTQFGNY